MADELSLLFRLKAENAQAKAVMADTRAAIGQLRQSFGPQLTQTLTVANETFSRLDGTLQNFVAQRLPLVGGALVQVTDKLRGFTGDSAKSQKALSNLAGSIQSIATQSGKSVPQIANFLTKFVQIEGQAKRNEAAFNFFGGSVDLIGNKTAKFLPELEQASEQLAGVAAEGATAGASLAAMAGPIGIAVLAIGANIAAVVSLTKELFDLAKASADYQGKLFDLSQQTGVAVETLSALEVVARTTGSSIEGLTQSLGIFQKNLEEATEDADSKAGKAFKRLGVELGDTEQTLRRTIAALARMPPGFRQTAAALEVFGRGGKAFLAIAKEANGDIDQITEKLRNLGLVTGDQAKLADEFNDQLVLLQVQLRGLGTQAIPVFLDGLKDVSTTLETNRAAFDLVGLSIKLLAAEIVGPLRTAFTFLNLQVAASNAVLKPFADLIDRVFDRIDRSKLPPPGTPTPAVPEPTKDPFTKSLEDEVAARKRLQGVLSFDVEERKRLAQASIAQAQRDFEAGRQSREDLLNTTIKGIKGQAQAEIDGLQTERKIKLQEQALAKDDLDKRTQLGNAILSIDTQIANKRAELKQRELDERAKFQQEELTAEQAHQERLLERSRALDAVNIKAIEQQVALGKKAALDADKEIEGVELTAIDRQQAHLVRRLEMAGKDLAKRKEIQDQIAALDTERTATQQRHSDQRLAIATRESDILLQLIQTKGESLIAAAQALANTRVITEEEAERRIAKIRVDALDTEIDLAKTKGQDLRVLNAQREILQAESERNIEAGRQRDLENERSYSNELRRIKERAQSLERDVATEAIRLMQTHFASQREIIRTRTRLDLDEENTQHQTAQRRLDELARENRESKKTQQEKLEFEQELNRLREAEAERHRLALQGIKDAGARDEKNASPLGRLGLDTENLKELASVIESQLVPLGETLTRTFLQVADAIGQTVANWVLLGETGPAVMRKILAQALASIAAEATVNAIKEAALGFATLFFNPAESAAHFTAAALWGSIAGVSAIAGRGVAGDLFKSKGAGAGGSATTGQNGTGQLNPLTLERTTQQQRQEVVVTVNVKQDPHSIVDVFAKDFQSGGKTREVVINDGMFGG